MGATAAARLIAIMGSVRPWLTPVSALQRKSEVGSVPDIGRTARMRHFRSFIRCKFGYSGKHVESGLRFLGGSVGGRWWRRNWLSF
jgi:hypothetical protein